MNRHQPQLGKRSSYGDILFVEDKSSKNMKKLKTVNWNNLNAQIEVIFILIKVLGGKNLFLHLFFRKIISLRQGPSVTLTISQDVRFTQT